jgi:transcriptional regulator with XRE-family HTH domain
MISEFIKHLRDKHDLTQEYLAKTLGHYLLSLTGWPCSVRAR